MEGGASCTETNFGDGTVFKLDPSGNETVLYSFIGTYPDFPNGAEPSGGLALDGSGNLFGTTSIGGSMGYGTVFKLDTSGNETVRHSFLSGDGALPIGDLTRDSAGNL